MTGEQPIYSVSDFVAICNQVLDISFGAIQISGELSQFRISKNKWVYFDLKDDHSNVRFFGSVYQLPGPLEDGMLITVRGTPQLHPKFGFSITVQSIQLKGEGTIKKAAQLLEMKLEKEGLFALERKRTILYPPTKIGLITSGESAAYADFIKIMNQRWGGVEITLYDVQVQGEQAPAQIVEALTFFNGHSDSLDAIVVTRGGGSADDLQAFSTELVTRAIAGSRIPTLVAIGHEIDTSLAERAADIHASTPSNAAEILVPDKKNEHAHLAGVSKELARLAYEHHQLALVSLSDSGVNLSKAVIQQLQEWQKLLLHNKQTLSLLSPHEVLRRGYAIITQGGKVIQSAKNLSRDDSLAIQFHDGEVNLGSK